MDTETALLWGFLVLLLLVLVTIFFLLVHSGIFTHVEVKTCKPDIGEIYIAYKFARGPYKESGALFTQIHTLLPEYRTVGVYYDDPKMKQPQKLRYIVGVILAENGSTVNPEHQQLLKEHGYEFATFPAIDHAVQTTFPFNSTISIVVAVMKVYPALREYVEARSLCARPFLEVYNNKQAEILFIGPLARQDDFYVPEVQLDEDQDHQNDYDDDDRTENSSRSWNESASFVRDDVAENPTPAPTPTHVAAPAQADIMPPPRTPPAAAAAAAASPVPAAAATPPPLSAAAATPPPPSAAAATPPPPSAAAATLSPPSVPISPSASAAPPSPAATASTPPFSPPTTQMPPPPAPMPPATPPVTPATPTPTEPTETVDTAESGSLGGEESDANTGSSFEEIDEREAAIALLSGGGDGGGDGDVKKDDDEGER